MKIFRITNKKYADDLTGRGAASNDGRWNKTDTPVLYCDGNVERTHNFVLNCGHPNYVKVKLLEKQAFPIDFRLTKN